MHRLGKAAIAMAILIPGPALAEPMAAPRIAATDAQARSAMTRTGARGLALAVIEDGQPVMVRAWGHRNAAGDPLETDTIMYGASLTKAVFAYTVMQLRDEGMIALDGPIAEMISRPLPDYGNLDAYGNWGDLAGDERWRALTPRHLLTHSSGFANFSFLEPDGKLSFHFHPGSRYGYSGEGIILLQFAIEEGIGLNLGAEMQRRVFDRFAMPNSSLIWRADFARNFADGWTAGRLTAASSRTTSAAGSAPPARWTRRSPISRASPPPSCAVRG
jgi:CubicO group peptidase (beta-lactamase class C family)